MEISVKYYHLYFEITTNSCKCVYIYIFEGNMAGRFKITTNSIRNLMIQHFKDDTSMRTITKLVKVNHSTVYATIN